MRVTFPNPLGPPIAIDTSRLPSLSLPTTIQPFLSRRGHLRLVLLILFLVTLLGVQPSPPFPPSYAAEWKVERNLPWLYGAAKFPEGREGRYLK